MAYTTIDDPSAYFQAKTYTGTGSSLAITNDGNSNLQPDWLWIKNRGTVDENVVHDSVRSVGKRLLTDGSQAEATTTNQVTSFDTNGFTVHGGSNNTGASSNNYVAWQWKASGSTASNTDGTITSTVSANTTAGFSIVSWTGDGSASSTVGHGLGSSGIDMLITKNRDNGSSNWYTKHKDLASDNVLLLDSTTGQFSNIGSTWGGLDNLSASTVFGFDAGSSGVRANLSGEKQIAYCFKSIKGYSKFGSYTGNGSTDGVFCFTGMRPAWIMWKKTSSTANWAIRDNKMDPHNPSDNNLFANLSDAESSSNDIDFLSNGFKLRTAGSNWNSSGATYIYMAFAENPFVSSVGIPCTAR